MWWMSACFQSSLGRGCQPSLSFLITRADGRGGWTELPTTGGDLGATGWPGWQDTKRVAGHLGQGQGYEPSHSSLLNAAPKQGGEGPTEALFPFADQGPVVQETQVLSRGKRLF